MPLAVDVIRKKRDGEPLSRAEIDWMVGGIARGDVTDAQWSALLMAIVLKGMSHSETVALTEALIRSGAVVDPGSRPEPTVDALGTGPEWDKTWLVLAPIAAAAGVAVPMESGSDREFAPAAKFLDALRDATATTESIPLLVASILARKRAKGIDGLVLDARRGEGNGAADARGLAESLCDVGRSLGTRVVALVTRMDQPIGRATGAAAEMAEAIACLKGNGPADLTGLALDLAAEMVRLAGPARLIEEARTACERTIADGSALAELRRRIAGRGGDPRVVDDPGLLPRPRRIVEVASDRGGCVVRLQARLIAEAASLLGVGRVRPDATIDSAVGLVLHKKVGDSVEPGDSFCSLLVNDGAELERASEWIADAYHLDDDPVETPSAMVIDRLVAGGVG